MKNTRELSIVVSAWLTTDEATDWKEYVRQNEMRPNFLLCDIIRRELEQRNFANEV